MLTRNQVIAVVTADQIDTLESGTQSLIRSYLVDSFADGELVVVTNKALDDYDDSTPTQYMSAVRIPFATVENEITGETDSAYMMINLIDPFSIPTEGSDFAKS